MEGAHKTHPYLSRYKQLMFAGGGRVIFPRGVATGKLSWPSKSLPLLLIQATLIKNIHTYENKRGVCWEEEGVEFSGSGKEIREDSGV